LGEAERKRIRESGLRYQFTLSLLKGTCRKKEGKEILSAGKSIFLGEYS